MYTKEALRNLGIKGEDFTSEQMQQFDKLGYLVIENVLTADECRSMAAEFERIFDAEQGQGGHEVHIEPGERQHFQQIGFV